MAWPTMSPGAKLRSIPTTTLLMLKLLNICTKLGNASKKKSYSICGSSWQNIICTYYWIPYCWSFVQTFKRKYVFLWAATLSLCKLWLSTIVLVKVTGNLHGGPSLVWTEPGWVDHGPISQSLWANNWNFAKTVPSIIVILFIHSDQQFAYFMIADLPYHVKTRDLMSSLCFKERTVWFSQDLD